MCLKILHHVQANPTFWAKFEANLIAVCSVPLFAKRVAAQTGQNHSSRRLSSYGERRARNAGQDNACKREGR